MRNNLVRYPHSRGLYKTKYTNMVFIQLRLNYGRKLKRNLEKAHMRHCRLSITVSKCCRFLCVLQTVLFLFWGLPDSTHAEPGDLDQTFGMGGKVMTDLSRDVDSGYAIGLQSDGKILAAGTSYGAFALIRYNPNGTVDPSFGIDGVVKTEGGGAFSLGIQGDSKIVLGGISNNNFALVRYNPNGNLDTSFGNAGLVTTQFINSPYSYLYAIGLQPDGKIVAAGNRVVLPDQIGNYDFALARYNTDGSLDTNFGISGFVITDLGGQGDTIRTLALQPDGKIVAGGFTYIYAALVRYNPDGSLDNGFGTGGVATADFGGVNSVITAVLLQPDGKIVVAGNNDFSEFVLARFESNGSLDLGFGTNGIVITPVPGGGLVEDVVLQSDGRILVGGSNSTDPSPYDFALARYNPNGSLDTTFGNLGIVTTDFDASDERIRALLLQPDGKVVAVGETTTDGSNVNFALARYLTDSIGWRNSRAHDDWNHDHNDGIHYNRDWNRSRR